MKIERKNQTFLSMTLTRRQLDIILVAIDVAMAAGRENKELWEPRDKAWLDVCEIGNSIHRAIYKYEEVDP